MAVFRKNYRAQIDIKASPEKVWEVLVDLERYPVWNPFTIQVETNWQVGSKVILLVQMQENRKSIRQVEYLTRLNPKEEIAWGLDWGIWLQAERTQKIVPSTSSQVRYETEDIIRGPLCPLVHFLYGKYIQKGFENVAQALKRYIEAS